MKKPKCKRGYPCGKSCISLKKICRKEFPKGISSLLDSRVTVYSTLLREPPKKVSPKFITEHPDLEGKPLEDIINDYAAKLGDPELAKERATAIRNYSDKDYMGIRKAQRDPEYAKKNPGQKKMADLIEDYLADSNVPYFKQTIYRGMGMFFDEFKEFMDFKEGEIMTMNSMNSFTSSLSVAKDFLDGSREVMLKLVNNTKAKSIKGFSKHGKEDEVLAPKGVTYRIKSREDFWSGKRIVYTIEEV